VSYMTKNVFTIDVEDHYYKIGLYHNDPRFCGTLPSRTVASVGKLLDILAERNIRATMFVLGGEAQRNPSIVKQIADAGHEIGCHGMWHRLIPILSPDEFRSDTEMCKKLLEDQSGQEVVGFRAPAYSITPQASWAFDILTELGFIYDTSTFNGHSKHGGWPGSSRKPHFHGSLLEMPLASTSFLGKSYAFGAGARLRISPAWLVTHWMRKLNDDGTPCIILVHPWEVDADAPEIPMLFSLKRRLITSWGVRSYPERISRIIKDFSFITARELAEEWIKQNK
jgi:polysaccharide deacetylase family protein (PEP-CTERM system associated)